MATPPGWLSTIADYTLSWLGGTPSETPRDAEPALSRAGREQVRSGPAGVVMPNFLPWMNDATEEPASARAAYRKMMADPNVKSAVLGKILDVSALTLTVHEEEEEPEGEEHADYVRWNMESYLQGGVPELCWSILSGQVIDGHCVCEKVYAEETEGRFAGRWGLEALKPKDVGNDVILQTDSYKNVVGVLGLRYNAGRTFSPSAFVIQSNLPLYGQPTGTSDLRAVYGRYWLLDTVLKLRGINAEKRAMPFLIGTYVDPGQKDTLEAMLAQVKSQNWASVPEGVKVEAVNIAGAADSTFADFVRDLKHDIFLGIQGAILQALEGSVTDGRGSSQVHRSTADLLVWYLAQRLQSVFNDRRTGLIREMVGLNYEVKVGYPRATLAAIDVNELLRDLDIDGKLHDMGLPLSKDELYERYNRSRPHGPDDELTDASLQQGQARALGKAGADDPGVLADILDGTGDPIGKPRGGDQPGNDQPTGDLFGEPHGVGGCGCGPAAFDAFADDQAFSGVITDTRGVRRCYRSGKQVPCGRAKATKAEKRAAKRDRAAAGRTAGAGETQATPEAEKTQATKTLIGKMVGGAKELAASGREMAAKVGEAAWDKMSPRQQKAAAVVNALRKKVWDVVEIGQHKGKELVREIQRERGIPDDAAEKTTNVVATVDAILTWTVGFAVYPATGSATASKVAGLIPIGALSYAAYSTAKNPLAVMRAAVSIFRKKKDGAATHHAESDGHPDRDAIAQTMDFIASATDQDWATALVMAALDATGGDLAAAVQAASEAMQANPTPPSPPEEA